MHLPLNIIFKIMSISRNELNGWPILIGVTLGVKLMTWQEESYRQGWWGFGVKQWATARKLMLQKHWTIMEKNIAIVIWIFLHSLTPLSQKVNMGLCLCSLLPDPLASTRAVKQQRCRSYDYSGQHKQSTILLPLEVKYCLDRKAINLRNNWCSPDRLQHNQEYCQYHCACRCCLQSAGGEGGREAVRFSLDFHFREAVNP